MMNFLFQFPSNGKVYSESTKVLLADLKERSFQFPSNGKVYSEYIYYVDFCKAVGIEFQFPSNGKVYSE